MLRRLLHRLSRRPAAVPGFGPLPPMPSSDAEDWLMKPHGGGVLHWPVVTRVERGAVADAVLPVPQRPARRPLGRLFSASGSTRDGTRTP